jgi:SNF2 family DNA or RNA helicase
MTAAAVQLAPPGGGAGSGLTTSLWRHQQAGFDFARNRSASMLAMKMGHGKSLTTLALLEEWDAERVLILCPKSVVAAWPEQFRRHVSTPWTICPLDSGTVADRVRVAEQVLATSTRVALIVNYDAAIQMAMMKLLKAQSWDVLVCDESHRLKSPRGVTSRLARELARKSRKRLALTGTPMPHSPLDIWAQARLLDQTVLGSSYVSFRNEYAVSHPMFPSKVLRFQRLDQLERRMATFAYRSPDDAVDLPEATHVTRTFELSPSARKVYQEMEKDFTTTLAAYKDGDATVTASNVLVKLIRLQQITSGHIKDDGGEIVHVDDGKRRLLADVLEDLDPSEPVVVFCRFKADLAAVEAIAGDRYRELSGNRRDLTAWQNGDGVVLGVQLAAGGVGIDLTRASVCVYYSVSYSLGEYEQSLARVHRPGQQRPVLYVHLVANDSIDGKIYKALHEKRDVVESLLDSMTRDQLLRARG